MQIYKVFDSSQPTRAQYAGSLSEAHVHAKLCEPRADIRIELADVPTDKGAVLLYLNGQAKDIELTPMRTWALTDRGGLKEIANGE